MTHTDSADISTPADPSRRSVLTALGGVGAASLTAVLGACSDTSRKASTTGGTGGTASTAACVLAPEETTGPYYLDYDLVRSNITEGKMGIPVQLDLTMVDATNSCRPLRDIAIHLWQCDASGHYSGYTQYSISSRPPVDRQNHAEPTDNQKFLRGIQVSNADGKVNFTTIYPGWYGGRAMHIHLRAVADATVKSSSVTGGHVSHTGQLYFPEQFNDQIAAQDPYKANRTPRMRNKDDAIYNQQGGAQSMLTITPLRANGPIRDGLRASIVLGIDPKAVPPVQSDPNFARPSAARGS